MLVSKQTSENAVIGGNSGWRCVAVTDLHPGTFGVFKDTLWKRFSMRMNNFTPYITILFFQNFITLDTNRFMCPWWHNAKYFWRKDWVNGPKSRSCHGWLCAGRNATSFSFCQKLFFFIDTVWFPLWFPAFWTSTRQTSGWQSQEFSPKLTPDVLVGYS